MRRKAATAVVVLIAVTATPAALAKESVSINGTLVAALRVAQPAAIPVALARKDSIRSCQAGASKARVRAANETERKAATVACEQPPRSNVNIPGGLKTAEAGALATGG